MEPLTVERAWLIGSLERTDAAVLLEHVSGWSRASLIAHPERVLTPEMADRYRHLAKRRAAGEPIAYLVGSREFFGLVFDVGPAVLIPRPETELLVELALERYECGARRFLDLATGSGAVAVAIAKHALEAEIWATDLSKEALAVGASNADRHAVKVHFEAGSWFEPVASEHFERFDVIVSNPPYIAAGDPHLVQGDLRFEPSLALVAGADGLDALRAIVAGARSYLRLGGAIYLEHGHDQAPAVRALLAAEGFDAVRSWQDLQGHERVSGGKIGL